ncbi:hypothetical protein CWR48_03755 [Oceanobacillus arenosus]|uniref:Uncharacterized protein n=1 Tax=Oceanobacillus arenosus TaxID=1229153 RepID=A0A3D8PYC0_9BACI|nr:hypothetical protein [Oceanobacillus arenosus]RDW21083.1 hypothetical protein CWR48_03755 [Oceanobacillus arenosus]
MIRYWKSISIILVVILAIGAFYIQAAFAGKSNPEFAITTKSGDETVFKNISLHSNYQMDDLIISTEGSKYQDELSYVDRLVGFYTNSKIKQLQSDYRSFMRGKGDITELYEDEGILAYAEVEFKYHRGEASDFSIDIEVLDKESKERSAFTVDVPEKKNYNYVYINDVRVIDGTLKVTTTNALRSDQFNSDEVHIYHFNLTEQTLVKDEIIGAEQEGKHGKLDYVRLMNDYDELSGEKYLVFEMVYVEDINLEDENLHPDYYPEYIGSEFLTYNLETGEQKRIEIPDEAEQLMKQMRDTPGEIIVNNSKLHFIEVTETGLELIVYNIENGETESKQSVEIPKTDMDLQMNWPMFKIIDDKLYIVSSQIDRETQSPIMVADLNSGDILYVGTVEDRDSGQEKEIYGVNIYDLVVD